MLDNSMTITIITLIITMYYVSIYLKKKTHTHHVVLGISKTVTQDHKGSPSDASRRRLGGDVFKGSGTLRGTGLSWIPMKLVERCFDVIYIWCIYG